MFLIQLLLLMLVHGSCTKKLIYEPDTSMEEIPIGDKIEIKLSVEEPGGLESALGYVDYRKICKLTVKGSVNGTDLKYIRFISGADEYGNETDGSLESLDLSAANLVEGGEPYFIYVDKDDNSETPINLQNDELSQYAFGYCKLKEIILPNSIRRFGSQAFYSCGNLITINIPGSLQEIGRSVFCYCNNLKSEIILPNGITEIPDYTFFECANLTSVTLPESVMSLGYGCFAGCSKIVSLGELPNLRVFGERCFENCKKLETFKIPSSMTSIPNSAFSGCWKLNNIDVSNIVKFGYKAFCNCQMITYINMCDRLEYVDHYAFYRSGLEMDLNLPETVKYVGYEAFYGTDITSVIINSDIRTHETEDVSFRNPQPFGLCKKLKSVRVSEGCKILGLSFSSCSALEFVSLPNSLDSLGYYFIEPEVIGEFEGEPIYSMPYDVGYIFSGCTSLKTIMLPENLKFIATCSFRDCSSLEQVVLPNSLSGMESYVFSGCTSLSFAKLSESLETIPQGCFEDCSGLKSISIPDCIKELDYASFENSGLQSVAMPEDLVEIGNRCFSGCAELKSITIPSKVRKIGDNAFGDCMALNSVLFESEGALKSIGVSAFYHCTLLENVQLPEGVTSIGDCCFSVCGLQDFSIPSTLQDIGEGCIDRCLKLTDIRNYSGNPQTIKNNTLGQIQPEKILLHVPANSIDLYKADPLWSVFPNVVGL